MSHNEFPINERPSVELKSGIKVKVKTIEVSESTVTSFQKKLKFSVQEDFVRSKIMAEIKCIDFGRVDEDEVVRARLDLTIDGTSLNVICFFQVIENNASTFNTSYFVFLVQSARFI